MAERSKTNFIFQSKNNSVIKTAKTHGIKQQRTQHDKEDY